MLFFGVFVGDAYVFGNFALNYRLPIYWREIYMQLLCCAQADILSVMT